MIGSSSRAWRAAALLLLASGCSILHPKKPEPPKPALQLHVQAGDNTNYGGPLYMIVRKTNRQSFLAEDYDGLAGTVFNQDDPTILRKQVIWPRDRFDVKIDKEKAEDVLGVYFFYSVPGQSWRFAVVDPAVKNMRVVLGTNEIQSIEPGR